MTNKIDLIIRSMENGEKIYSIDNKGKIQKILGPNGFKKTAFYIDDKGRVMEKRVGAADSYTGYIRDKADVLRKKDSK